jgi:glutathione synthase/RimK-type ligase-like ATP-grasp enzyme
MTRQVAIHHRDRSFSHRWVEYCDERKIPYTVVDCLRADAVSQLRAADVFLWHWHHQEPREQLVARHVIRAAELMGLAVFPNTATCWHYDDKVAQKYLLESVGAPLVPTYVFFDLDEALEWTRHTVFPKVFKLRKGGGSANVRLVRDADQARRLVHRAFTKGFSPVAGYGRDAARRYRTARRRRDLLEALRRLPATLRNIRQLNRELGPERGYAYFQDFIPGNQYDTRVTVIGERAFAFTRNVRPSDFRASGSGDINYALERVRPECLTVAFDAARRIGAQSLAFDFVLTPDHQPKVVEVSYCFDAEAVFRCRGHWDDQLRWHEGHLWPQDAILVDLLNSRGIASVLPLPSGASPSDAR